MDTPSFRTSLHLRSTKPGFKSSKIHEWNVPVEIPLFSPTELVTSRPRGRSKPVFAKVWKTAKLLSSADAIAISKPPEQGSEEYADPDAEWLHLDQAVYREGLHAFQGGVYLEETNDTDHCLRVMTHSHLYHKDFFEKFPKAATRSRRCEFLKLSKEQRKCYVDRGCTRTKVPVPKGGMVLWDSRTVHDNMAPVCGRPHTDRWRFVVFVSMQPAIWASRDVIEKKNEAYKKMLTI